MARRRRDAWRWFVPAWRLVDRLAFAARRRRRLPPRREAVLVHLEVAPGGAQQGRRDGEAAGAAAHVAEDRIRLGAPPGLGIAPVYGRGCGRRRCRSRLI